jgi:hypothetical protein
MTQEMGVYDEARIQSLIVSVQNHRVILDSDLAMIYGVTTKRLNGRKCLEQPPRHSDEHFRCKSIR